MVAMGDTFLLESLVLGLSKILSLTKYAFSPLLPPCTHACVTEDSGYANFLWLLR